MNPESKHAAMKEIAGMLADGEYELAHAKIKENNILPVDISEIASKAYQKLEKERNYAAAIRMCEEFNLPAEMKIDAVSAQFRLLSSKNEFEKAHEWGVKYGITKNDLNGNAVKAFEAALDEQEIERAIEYLDTFQLPPHLVAGQARSKFNYLFDTGKYLKAFFLGNKFDMSRKRTLTAGLRGYVQLLGNGAIQDFVDMEKQFHVLHDRDIVEVDEDDRELMTEKLCSDLIEKYLLDDRTKELHEVLDSLEILTNYQKKPILQDVRNAALKGCMERHGRYIAEGRGPAAFELVENFDLLGDDVPQEIRVEVIKAAENAHNDLLSKKNLTAALFLKQNYRLFDENVLENSNERFSKIAKEFLAENIVGGSIEGVRTFVREYKIAEEEVQEAVTHAVKELLDKGHYDTIFDIMKTLKIEIADNNTLNDALMHFHRIYEDGNMGIASDLAYYFKLKEGRVPKAHAGQWQILLDRNKYKEALAFKKERKFDKKMIEPFLKERYDRLMASERVKEAIQLRKDYKFSISIVQLLVEGIKRFFGG